MTKRQYLTIHELRSKLPGSRGNRSVAPSTITRWVLLGARALDGTLVKLPATRAGRRWLFTEEDVDAFFAALAGNRVQVPCSTQTPRQAASAAASALERMGA